MTTPKTNVSFPTFVRFNLISQNLTEDKKKKALTVTEGIVAKNTHTEQLISTKGGCLVTITYLQEVRYQLR